ncbi:YlbG family protein [Streptococcaceae bacterium ESL0687]|nr:YlbG family protein [Streptococcaceae bacterium ESL0687]
MEVKFELQKRRALYVYYNSYKHVRRLKKYGDFVYTSKRLRYVKIYVNEEDYEQIKAELAGLHFVKGVEESFLPDLEMNFSEEY